MMDPIFETISLTTDVTPPGFLTRTMFFCNNRALLPFQTPLTRPLRVFSQKDTPSPPTHSSHLLLDSYSSPSELNLIMAKTLVSKKAILLQPGTFSGRERLCDDPWNTGNVWVETEAVNYHDETGEVMDHVPLEAGNTAKKVKRVDINDELKLYASRSQFIQFVAKKCSLE